MCERVYGRGGGCLQVSNAPQQKAKSLSVEETPGVHSPQCQVTPSFFIQRNFR